LEIPEMSNNGTTPSNGRHGRSGVEALITTPGTASVREMVSVAVEALGIDLSKELTNETREAIARRASQ
jgi:GDP-D-mannose dehydratase